MMEFEISSPDFITNDPKHNSSIESLDLLKAADLTYNDFFEKYMYPNIPCIIRPVSEHWNCTKLWFDNGHLKYDYLRKTYGDLDVTIYNCLEKYYNTHKTLRKSFSSYLSYFEQENKESLHYLKDWHLKNCKSDDDFYEVPIFFASDWLNEYLISSQDDDYRFVYMGPKGTWTPFHADVFSSYSWSVNVFGKKRWIFLPPGVENILRESSGNLPFDVEEQELPPEHIEVIQEAGDAIFVPSGWHHQVWNLEDTVSVNHNWVNGCNIHLMYEAMASDLIEVRKEISDLADTPDFEEHCQLMLHASFGMDYRKFYNFLKHIALSRIEMLTTKNCTLFHGHVIGRNHIIFDLNAIANVLKSFSGSTEASILLKNVETGPMRLLDNVLNAIKNNSNV